MMNTPTVKMSGGGTKVKNASPYIAINQPPKFVKEGKNCNLAKVSADDQIQINCGIYGLNNLSMTWNN